MRYVNQASINLERNKKMHAVVYMGMWLHGLNFPCG